MELTRRKFLEGGLGAATVFGFSLFDLPPWGAGLEAAEATPIAEVPVIWLATGACTGCSVSLMNSASPTIQELLLQETLPGHHLSLGFHTTIMAATGEQASATLESVTQENDGKYVLIIDGATATEDDGLYCRVGEHEGRPRTGYEQVVRLGSHAMAVLAVGACASFGGIPAAAPNPTACVSIGEIFQREGISTPYVNIPGCPPHPDWIVGTIATFLLGGLEALQLDELHRPPAFFGKCIHDNCQYRGSFERGLFAERYGEHGCLLKLGCKGPITYADCPVRKFNNGTSWCCEAGHPCIGCCHPDFPFAHSLFAPVEPAGLDFPAMFADAQQVRQPNTSTYVAVGLLGAGGFVAGVGSAAAALKLKAAQAAAAAESDSVEEDRDAKNES